jgi:SAM-dependent methyltransferase
VQRPYRNHLRALRPGRFLEIGCGIGRNLQNARDFAEGVGIDHNPTSVELARARGLVALTPEDFLASPLAALASFDSLLLSHLIEHLTPDEALALLSRWLPFLRQDGQVIVVTPQERGFGSDPTHVHFFDLPACAELLRRAGVSVERQHSFPFPRWAGRWFTYNEFVTVGRVVPTTGPPARGSLPYNGSSPAAGGLGE